MRARAAPKEKERPPPAGGNALVTFDAQIAVQRKKEELEKHRAPREIVEHTGPRIKWEETGMYKAMVKSQEIEDELTKIRNLIRKRTDPNYEPDDDDFSVAPVRKFNAKVDYYKLLEVDDFASAKDIKGAYKKLALHYHPDKNRGKKAEELHRMQEEFEKIQEAYEVLSDRATRRQYDRTKFDEARAKSQGMGSSMYSQGANTDGDFWGRWSGKKEKKQKTFDANAFEGVKPQKLPKAADLRIEVKISLEKALRGGMKIRDVKRDRMQRAYGGATETGKTFHIPIAQGQANGSEYRLEGEGLWPGTGYTPGDLVAEFKHKPHQYLRQAASGDGHLEVSMPLMVRAKASDRVLSVWSPTFKGQMVLVRFLNPLIALAPNKACSVCFRVDGEGLPVVGEAGKTHRGVLTVNVTVQLEGEPLMATLGTDGCKEVLVRRHARSYNHQSHLRAEFSNPAVRGLPVRKYCSDVATERGGHKVALPAVIAIWECPPETDVVVFAKAASALGWHAKRSPEGYIWCYHRGLARPPLPKPVHHALDDDELASDDEEERAARQGASAPARKASEEEAAPPRKRVPRKRPEAEDYMLRFDMAPPGGFPDPGSTDEEEEGGSGTKQPGPSRPKRPDPRAAAASAAPVAVQLVEAEQESKEEQDLTRLIRQKQNELDQAKRKWTNKKRRQAGERNEEESTLRELLEKDKEREYQRIEKEMNGLRSNFETQINAEKKWMADFTNEVHFNNEWVCVFKPQMVARKKPTDDGPVSRMIMFDEVVKAKSPPTDDYWLRLDGRDDWALTWHQKHGQLLQKWFGKDQKRYLDIEKKINERRKVRNQTFLDYKRKKKEVSEWRLPPGPTEEELYEIEDEEGEQLQNLLEPLLKAVKEHKRRLRELRQKRLQAANERAERESGEGKAAALGSGQLPTGFRLEEEKPKEEPSAPASTDLALAGERTGQASAAPAAPAEPQEWERHKQVADKAFKDKEWNSAVTAYTQALEVGGGDLSSMQVATLLSNRALVHARLFDWQKSLEDAMDATIHESEWPKGWLRRATAELRLNDNRQALKSLRRGFACAGKIAGQLLPLATEVEAALYGDRDDKDKKDEDAPDTATERIQLFRTDGTKAFEQSDFGTALFCFTRALYHRTMMEGRDEAIIISNRSAAFLKLGLPSEALADALAAAEKDNKWAKPLVRAAQAAHMLDDFKAAYQHFAKARRLEDNLQSAADGLSNCLQRIIKWEYSAASRRWSRFKSDARRPREGVRIWALSDVFFDQIGVPEWCKSLSSSFYRDDVLMLAGNLADALPNLRFALTVLKSKFRRIFYVPGNHDLWVRRATLGTILKGEKVVNEERAMVDSVSKLLEVLQVCDEMGVETAPAEVAAGVFVVPMFSWYQRDFMSKEQKQANASQSDADAKITIDQWVKWPFPGGADDAWKFFMRMNEASLRAVLVSKAAFEQFAGVPANVVTMTHYLTRQELKIDWTVPGIWDYIGCDGLDEQIRLIGSDVHVYGHACTGHQKTMLDGVYYVHNYIGTTDKHRETMAPYLVYGNAEVCPNRQPTPH